MLLQVALDRQHLHTTIATIGAVDYEEISIDTTFSHSWVRARMLLTAEIATIGRLTSILQKRQVCRFFYSSVSVAANLLRVHNVNDPRCAVPSSGTALHRYCLLWEASIARMRIVCPLKCRSTWCICDARFDTNNHSKLCAKNDFQENITRKLEF